LAILIKISEVFSLQQWRSQEGLVPLQKNLNRSESTAQNFLEGDKTLLATLLACSDKISYIPSLIPQNPYKLKPKSSKNNQFAFQK